MWAIWTTLVLLVAALTGAMTLMWRRHSAEPVRVRKVEGSTCHPKVKR